MRLLPILILLLSSCAIEGPVCSSETFSLTAWQNESGMIRISYESELPGYELWIGCSSVPNYPPETYKRLDYKEDKTWAEWSITRHCTPMHIKVNSLDGRIEKEVKL